MSPATKAQSKPVKAKAIRFAKQCYEELLRNDLVVPIKTRNAFARTALSLH